MNANTLRTLKAGQNLQTKALDNGDPILVALAEHTQRFETKAAAMAQQNTELTERLFGVEQELAAVKWNRAYVGTDTAPSPVDEFIKSDQLQAMRNGANGTGRVAIKSGGIALLTKAITNSGVSGAGDTGYNVQPERWVGLGNNPMRPLRLLDVLPKVPVTTGSFEYTQLNGYANAAAVQAVEGVTKAEASVPTQVITAYVATIAHFVRASLQVLDDAPALGAQLDILMTYGCMDKLEAQLVNGPGGVGQIKGLSTQAVAFAATATDPQDRIGEAVTELLAVGWIPRAILMNPADWGNIQRKRGSTNDMYLLGSPRDPAPPSLWSVPVVLSASLAIGKALVLDTSQMSLLDRQEIVLASSREDGGNFTSNLVTLLAELRAGLAVYSPGAVLSVTLTPST